MLQYLNLGNASCERSPTKNRSRQVRKYRSAVVRIVEERSSGKRGFAFVPLAVFVSVSFVKDRQRKCQNATHKRW
jgi:hypothetical protein